ncbi:DgyrCDS5241 [Dimorphilus gyrociliatus]|uniref:DgyrCDS5241 n=1 Tax=Dimorphilus gyrociliatus TaxID=2664684 RepID=A0A7I8VLL4_9ANNE|nr:DgyrCDS5241 [Dimorphilus gyrociliatus]
MKKSNKKYGLVNLKEEKAKEKQKALIQTFQPRKNIFEDEESDEDEPNQGPGPVRGALRVEVNSRIKQKTQIAIEKALEEDPTVYQYDEVYDDIHNKKEAEAAKRKADKQRKSKYIGQLIKTSELRKLEDERRNQRILQKESEKEKDKFADKEEFVTESYKKRVEQLKQDEERQRQQDLIDGRTEKNDVTKQDDLSMFYRQLLNKESTEPKAEEVADNSTEKTGKNEKPGLPETSRRKRVDESSSESSSDGERPEKKDRSEYIPFEKLYREAAIKRQKRREEEEKLKRKDMAEKYKRKADNETVSDAKMRYLMRKQQKPKVIIEDSD